MPDLDVSFVLDDPMFRDTATLVRTTIANTAGYGVPTTTETTIEGVFIAGYAMPGGDGGLMRRPDGEMNTNGLTAITRGELSMGDKATGRTADIIRWRGLEYTVIASNDYSNFGEGYFLAIADQIPFNA
jgi:hypothetical protein